MEKLLENAWSLFVAIGWFFINRLTAKLDDKADSSDLADQRNAIRDLDKRVDELNHTSVGRAEFKADIGMLHVRANELEKAKQDKIKTIRIDKDKK
jgi:hypothetical protein